MENSQALEIAESIFADAIKRRLVGGDYEERALQTIRAALATPVGWRLPASEEYKQWTIEYYHRVDGKKGACVYDDGLDENPMRPLVYRGEGDTDIEAVMDAISKIPAPPHTEERG